MSIMNKVRNKLKETEKNNEPKMLDLETIERINARIEQMALDYDLPYPTGKLRPWQKEIMRGN